MTLKIRFALLLGLLLLGLGAAVVVVHELERNETAEVFRSERHLRVQLLNHWVDTASRALPQFATELASSETFAADVAANRLAAVRERLAAGLASSGVSTLWVLAADGAVLFSTDPAGAEAGEFPLARDAFAALVAQTPSPRCFAEHRGAVSELAVRRIPSPGGATWLAVGRHWDDSHLRLLAGLLEAKVTLEPPSHFAEGPPSPSRIQVLRPLPDWQGHPLRTLHVMFDAPADTPAGDAHLRQVIVILLFGSLLILALGLALHRWVLRPLGAISRSLASGDPAGVDGLGAEPHELGRVAQLVVASSTQRAALQREVEERARAQEALARSESALRENIEERARLGRDLHDGVIQSLYAAGMGLAGVRMQLLPGQTKAAAQLEQTRTVLNETIHDVRNFIVGLEPESLKLQTFSQAVTKLLDMMRSMRPFDATAEIDDDLAARLSLAQRLHALQIAREAVSNALRHGEAGQVYVALRAQPGGAEFEVADDGRGFDTASAALQGKGLANFTQRARELGGALAVESHPGQGTRVRLTFSL